MKELSQISFKSTLDYASFIPFFTIEICVVVEVGVEVEGGQRRREKGERREIEEEREDTGREGRRNKEEGFPSLGLER